MAGDWPWRSALEDLEWREDLPILSTRHLLIRVPRADEVDAVWSYRLRNREHLAAFEPDRTDDYYAREHWEESVRRGEREAIAGVGYRMAIYDRQEPGGVLGVVSLIDISRGAFQNAQVGYGLDRDALGRGIATEAAAATVQFAFDELDLKRVESFVAPENERSLQVMKRLGFQEAGRLRESMLRRGIWHDELLFSLVNRNWRGLFP
jgi:[ribosomal protein S5]-alanine N-acetyltransferase